MGNLNKQENPIMPRSHFRGRIVQTLLCMYLGSCAVTHAEGGDQKISIKFRTNQNKTTSPIPARLAPVATKYAERRVPRIQRGSADAPDSDTVAKGQPFNIAKIGQLLKKDGQYFQQFYNIASKRGNEVNGKIYVRVRVRPDGSVKKVTVNSDSKIDSRMAKCIKLYIGRWRLEPDSAIWETEFPILFVPNNQ